MKRFRAEPAGPQVYGLGEGPVWDSRRERLLWVDINVAAVHFGKLDGQQVVPTDQLTFTGTVGAVVNSAAGALLVAGSKGLVTISADGTRTIGPELISDETPSRLNDGGCDPAGRFLVGSLALDDRQHAEQLVRVEGGAVTVLDDDLSLSNGLAWSPDGTRFYSIDTTPGRVWVRDYDPATGATGSREVFLDVTDGSPDGMCADRDGNLWVAIWGAGEVRCFTPAGEHRATVEVAAPNTTSVAFVGPDLDLMLITTASEQLTADQMADFPHSGKLFTVSVDTTGLPVPDWSGS
jgi:sugar lactone lactonase YvrE